MRSSKFRFRFRQRWKTNQIPSKIAKWSWIIRLTSMSETSRRTTWRHGGRLGLSFTPPRGSLLTARWGATKAPTSAQDPEWSQAQAATRSRQISSTASVIWTPKMLHSELMTTVQWRWDIITYKISKSQTAQQWENQLMVVEICPVLTAIWNSTSSLSQHSTARSMAWIFAARTAHRAPTVLELLCQAFPQA